MLRTSLMLLLSPLLLANAFTVSFISPRSLDILPAGSTLQAQWQFLGNDSFINSGEYELYLCAGGNPSNESGDDTYVRSSLAMSCIQLNTQGYSSTTTSDRNDYWPSKSANT